MKQDQAPMNTTQALVKAIFDVRPPVMREIRINTPHMGHETVSLEVVLTPELIQAWGEQSRLIP